MSLRINSTKIESAGCRFIISFVFFAIWSLIMITEPLFSPMVSAKIASIFLIIVFGALIARSILAKNIVLLVFNAFFFLYTLPPKITLFDGIPLSWHTLKVSFDPLYIFQTCMIFTLFGIFLYLSIKILPQSNFKKVTYKNNDLLFYTIYFGVLLLTLYDLATSPTIFTGGGYGGNNVADNKAINEYILILVLILYYFAGKIKSKLTLINILIIMICLKTLLIGGRITMVMLLIMALFAHFQYIYKFRKLLMIFLLGIWGMTVFTSIRQDPMKLFSSNFHELIFPFFYKTSSRVIAQGTNEGDIFWASERLVRLIDEGILSYSERITAFIKFCGAPFFVSPGKHLLTTYRTDVYSTGGGGLLPIYMYAYLSYPGVILVGLFIGNVLNKLYKNESLWYFYAVIILMTTPRWFAYYPVQIIKLSVYAVIVYFIIISVDYTIKKRIFKNK